MNVAGKENAEVFPLNPPANNRYSHREGFPIIQFQIANQAKLLDPTSLRLNGTFKLLAPNDTRATLTNTSIAPVANSTTGINVNNRVGVASALHQITLSTLSNQTLETWPFIREVFSKCYAQ